MIRHIKEIHWQQSFFPGWLRVFVNPFYFARAGLCDVSKELSPILSGRLWCETLAETLHCGCVHLRTDC